MLQKSQKHLQRCRCAELIYSFEMLFELSSLLAKSFLILMVKLFVDGKFIKARIKAEHQNFSNTHIQNSAVRQIMNSTFRIIVINFTLCIKYDDDKFRAAMIKNQCKWFNEHTLLGKINTCIHSKQFKTVMWITKLLIFVNIVAKKLVIAATMWFTLFLYQSPFLFRLAAYSKFMSIST